MSVTVSTSGNITRINLSGEFDFSSQEALKQAFEQATATPAKEIIIDLQQTIFIDSSVIRIFLKLSDLALKNKKSLALVNCSQRIREIFEIGGFDQIFKIN